MTKKILLFILLLWAMTVKAQTTVNLTVSDTPDNQTWNKGTWSVVLQQLGAPPGGSFTNNCGGGSIANQTGSLTSSGTASIVLPSNLCITPQGTVWTFVVCPQASSPCNQSAQTVSNISPQALTITPPSIRISYYNASPPITAYADAEIVGAAVGNIYYNVTLPGNRQCTALPCSGANWSSTGGAGGVTSFNSRTGAVLPTSGDYTAAQLAVGALPNGVTATTQVLGDTSANVATDSFVINNGTGTGNGAQPILAISLSNNCPVANTGSCINTPANTQTFSDCNSTVSSAVITCTGSHFTSADVGKRIWGWSNCNAFQASAPTSLIAAATQATIQTFTSATQISMSVNATGQISNTNTGCIIYGNPDDSGATAASTLVSNSLSCPRVFFASSNYMFTKVPGFMSSQPPACANLGVIHGASGVSAFGNVFYPAGFELEGRGRGPTTIFITPGFPETGSCTNGSGTSCFYLPVGARWLDLSFTTGGGTNVGPTNAVLFQVDGPAGLDNVTCTNWDATSSASFGFQFHGWVRARQLDDSGCGNTGILLVNGTVATCIQCAVENQGAVGITVGQNASNSVPGWALFNLMCYDCTIFPSQLANNVIGLKSNAGVIKLFGGNIADNSSGASGLLGYNCATATCVLFADSVNFSFTSSTTNGSINCTAACFTQLFDTVLTSGATGKTYVDVAGSTLQELRNVWNTASAVFTGTTLIADGHSVKGACTGTVTAASTLGLYGTGANETLSSCTSTTIGNGIPVSGARTLENLIVTAGTAGVNASSGVVTVMRSTAGGALTATTITCTIGTGTRCSDGTHQVAVVDGDLISIQFTTQTADTLANVKAIVEWN